MPYHASAHSCLPFITPLAPSPARSLTVTRVFQDGVEMNRLPPTEPNGEVHYVIEYKREDSGNWTSVNTTSDSTHYNLTGLHSGTNYTVRVVAVNSAQRVNDIPLSFHFMAFSAAVVAGILVPFLLLTLLLITGITTGVVIWRRARGRQGKAAEKNTEHQKKNVMPVQTPEVAGELTEEQDGTKDYTYEYVIEGNSTIGRGLLYQGLNVETQDYVSVYEQLRGETYQELDCQGREAEHHYQKTNAGRLGCL